MIAPMQNINHLHRLLLHIEQQFINLFRQEMSDGRISMHRPLNPSEIQGLTGNEEQLLLLGVSWLHQELFGE